MTVAQRVERVHPLLDLDRGQLLGRALGRLAVEQRLDDPVRTTAGEHGDQHQRDDDDQEDREDRVLEEREQLVLEVGRDLHGAPSRAAPRRSGRAGVPTVRRTSTRQPRPRRPRRLDQLRDPAGASPGKAGPQMSTGGDHVAASVVDRRRDGVEPQSNSPIAVA